MATENYNWVPDKFFTEEQCQRLAELKTRWRAVLDAGGKLPAEEQSELEALVNAELIASGRRAEAMRKSGSLPPASELAPKSHFTKEDYERGLKALQRLRELSENLPPVDAVALIREIRDSDERNILIDYDE